MEPFIPASDPDPPAPFPRAVLDPDCRDGKHQACVGGPCECSCHAWEVELDPDFAELLTTD